MATIRPRLIHGFLEVCLLALLEQQPDYGLSLGHRLVAAGTPEIPGGTLYPALMRLEGRGLVAASKRVSDSGPPRKYYAITDDGRAELTERRAEWDTFSGVVTEILHPTAVEAR